MKNNSRRNQNTERNKMPVYKKILLTILSIIILFIQLSVYYFVFIESKNITWITVCVRILGIIIVIYLFSNQTMCSTYKLIWSSIVLFFSYAGPLLYLLFGNQRSLSKRKSKKVKDYLDSNELTNEFIDKLKSEDIKGYKFVKLVNASTRMPVYKNTSVKFYNNIEEKFYSVLEDIKNARRYIFIEMFILSTGKMLDMLIEALEEKGKEGIEIKLLYDDVGSKFPLRSQSLKKLKAIPNVVVETYEPLGFSINPAVNFRDHRKIIIIDGKIGYVGGDNIGDEYANWIKKYGLWRDNAVRLSGEAINSLVLMFSETWYMSSKEMLKVQDYYFEGESKLENSYVYPYCDGPANNCNPAYELYSAMAMNSENYLYISTPYISINSEFIETIVSACKSGVDVRILVPGIPDKKLVYKTTQSFYGEILKAGGRIYEYTPGFNHAKNYICDDKYAIVGTINMDYRSLYLHFENAVLLINDENIIKMKDDFLSDLEKSKEITYENWSKRSVLSKALQMILKVFSALM